MIPRRQRRLAGRHALVDGIPYEMPVNSQNSPALMAAFPIDADKAAELIPGGEVHPFRLLGGRGLLMITVIDYRTTDIGRYIEFSIAIACTHGAAPAPALLPGLLRKTYGTGQFVLDLPVSTEVSVKGGKGIWGMPKHQANLDFNISDGEVSSQYDLEGQLAMRIEIDRPHQFRIPIGVGAANYCAFRGLLMKSYIYFDAKTDLSLGGRSLGGRALGGRALGGGARLYLGDHPRVDPLRRLDIGSRPVFTAFLADSKGVLDDYFESWFLTYEQPPADQPEGLESVDGLGRSEEWLDPPTSPYQGRQVGT